MAKLEIAASSLTEQFGAPNLLMENRRARYRYNKTSPELLRTIKAVRVVSALNACAALLAERMVVEAGVVLRTIDDFLTEMNFVAPDEQGRLGPKQGKFVEDFFAEDLPEPEEMWEAQKRPGRVPKQKMQSAEARWLGQVTDDPHTVNVVTRNVSDVWSRYVHGSYMSSMELYADEKFHMCGIEADERLPGYSDQLAIYIHRSLNVFARLACDLGLIDLMKDLIHTREVFEASDAYPS